MSDDIRANALPGALQYVQHIAESGLEGLAKLATVHDWKSYYQGEHAQRLAEFPAGNNWFARAQHTICNSARQSLQDVIQQWHHAQLQAVWRGLTVHSLHHWPQFLGDAQTLQHPCYSTQAQDRENFAWQHEEARGGKGIPVTHSRLQAPFFGGERAGYGSYTRKKRVIWEFSHDARPWDRSVGVMQLHQFARVESFADVSLKHNAGRVVYGLDEPVRYTPKGSNAAQRYISGEVQGTRIPLPTLLSRDGRPEYLFRSPQEDERVVWDPEAGQLFLLGPATRNKRRTVKVEFLHRAFIAEHSTLSPLRFRVAATPPVAARDLPATVQAVFEAARAQGDSRLPNPLSEQEQLHYAAWRLGAFFTPEPQPTSLSTLITEGLQGLHRLFAEVHQDCSDERKNCLITADCELANAILYLGARAYGYNVRRVNGYTSHDYVTLQAQPRIGRHRIHSPGHAVVEHLAWVQLDPQLPPVAEYSIIDATPEVRPLHAHIAAKIAHNRKGDPQQRLHQQLGLISGAPQQRAAQLQAFAAHLRSGKTPQQWQQATPSSTVKSLNYVFSSHRFGSDFHGQILVYTRDPQHPQEQGALVAQIHGSSVIGGPAHHLALLHTPTALTRYLAAIEEPMRVRILDPELRKVVAMQRGIASANDLGKYEHPRRRSDDLRIANTARITCKNPDSTPSFDNDRCKPWPTHITIGTQRYTLPPKAGRATVRPSEHVLSNFEDKPFALDELLSLSFEHIAVTVPGYRRDHEFTAAWNAEHLLYIESPRDLGIIETADGTHYRFRWATQTTQRLQLGLIERKAVLSLESRRAMWGMDFIADVQDEVARLMLLGFDTLHKPELSEEARRELIRELYYTMAAKPPHFLGDSHVGIDPLYLREAIAVDYILRAAQELDLQVQVAEHLPSAQRSVASLCQDPRFDIPKPCSHQSYAVASHDELEEMLQYYVTTKASKLREPTSGLVPAMQDALDALRQRILPRHQKPSIDSTLP